MQSRVYNEEMQKQLTSLTFKLWEVYKKMEVLEKRLEGSSSRLSELKTQAMVFSTDNLQVCFLATEELDRIEECFKIMTGFEIVKAKSEVQEEEVSYKPLSLKDQAEAAVKSLKTVRTPDPCALPPACVVHITAKIDSKKRWLAGIVRKHQSKGSRQPYVAEANQLVEARKLLTELETANKDYVSAKADLAAAGLTISSLQNAYNGMTIPDPDLDIYAFANVQNNLIKLEQALAIKKAALEKDRMKVKTASDVKKIKDRCEQLKQEAQQVSDHAVKIKGLASEQSHATRMKQRTKVIEARAPYTLEQSDALHTIKRFISRREGAVTALSNVNLDSYVKGLSGLDREFSCLFEGALKSWYEAEIGYIKELHKSQLLDVNTSASIARFEMKKEHLMDELHRQLDRATNEEEVESAWNIYFEAVQLLTQEIENENRVVGIALLDFGLAKKNNQRLKNMISDHGIFGISQWNLLDKREKEIEKGLREAKTASDFENVRKQCTKLKEDADTLELLIGNIDACIKRLPGSLGAELHSFLNERVAAAKARSSLDDYIASVTKYNNGLVVLLEDNGAEVWSELEGQYDEKLRSLTSALKKEFLKRLKEGKEQLLDDLRTGLNKTSDGERLKKVWEKYFSGLRELLSQK